MRARLLAAVPVWFCLSGVVFATPDTPTMVVPVNDTITYSTRPWFTAMVNDPTSAHKVNHVIVSIDNRATYCASGNVRVDDSCPNPPGCLPNSLTFTGLPATSGLVKHRYIAPKLPAGIYYVCVKAGCDGGTLSAWSTERKFTVVDPVPAFTDTPYVSEATAIKMAHFNELRLIIINIRSYWNAGSFTWSGDYPLTVRIPALNVRVEHMQNLRDALGDPFVSATGTAPTVPCTTPIVSPAFTDNPVTKDTAIRFIHINELRDKVRIP